jgi:OmcA/MtrC family decaheme c-type cytochrome
MSQVARLALVLAGPTSDYTTYVSEDPRTRATGGQDGRYTYTFTAALPQNARGTYTIGIEGYRQLVLLAGTQKQMTVRDAGINKTINFAVGGGPVTPRRQVVSLAKCNNCHSFLSLHGNNRNTIEQCVLCHNPKETDTARRPAAERPAESVEMSVMIHRIHAGNRQIRDYSIYGFGSVKYNFNDVGYPGYLQTCDGCHINNSQQLPLRSTETIVDPRGLINPVQRTAAACTGCHTAVHSASHALANTTPLGEACASCHGPNATASVNRSHAR